MQLMLTRYKCKSTSNKLIVHGPPITHHMSTFHMPPNLQSTIVLLCQLYSLLLTLLLVKS